MDDDDVDLVELFDLDRGVELAWGIFAQRLADHIATLAGDGTLILTVSEDRRSGDRPPYVQLCGFGATGVRAEVASNVVLDADNALSPAEEVQLIADGWSAPDNRDGRSSVNFYVELDSAQAERVAAMLVTALRDTFAVQEPWSLQARAWNSRGPVLFDVDCDGFAAMWAEQAQLVPAYAAPGEREELVAQVSALVEEFAGHRPDTDFQGDLRMYVGDETVFVRVKRGGRMVEMFAALATGIDDRPAAHKIVAELNRGEAIGRYFLHGEFVLVGVRMVAEPLEPQLFKDLANHLVNLVATTGWRIAADMNATLL